MARIEPVGTIVSDTSMQSEIDQFLEEIQSDFGIQIPRVKQAVPEKIEPIYVQKRKPVDRNQNQLF